MPRVRDFSEVVPLPSLCDGWLPNGKPTTPSQGRKEARAIGEGAYEAARWLSAGGRADVGNLGNAAREALLAVNRRWSVTAIKSLFEVRAFHWGFREHVETHRHVQGSQAA